jgi:DNA-binding CsgD family transcriptional regulator
MFMIISKLCGYTYNKWVTGALLGAAVLMFAIICTTGYLDWYYTDATIENVLGATVLHKEYGILHPTNLIYVISYFVAMIVVLCVSLLKRKGTSQKQACIMLAFVVGNIGLWCIQKVVPWAFELLSAIYPISAFVFLCLWMMLQDYVHKKDIPKYTQAEKKELAIQITTMTMEEKISKVLFHLKNGENLTPREQEVLELILQHKKRREIGELLYVSESSVKLYTRTLYSKLGVSSREELYALLTQKNET